MEGLIFGFRDRSIKNRVVREVLALSFSQRFPSVNDAYPAIDVLVVPLPVLIDDVHVK